MTDPCDLYGLPLDRFVAERAALAKRLRSEGDRDRAEQVAKLRKPSVAAWAVNQLVRTQRGAVADLFESGDQLQRSQSELLAGRGDAAALRAAAERERVTVDDLTATARGLLTSQGQELSAAVLERVRETLHAAALDRDARGQVKDGCLRHELRHVGMGPEGLGGTAKRSSEDRPQRKQARATQADRAEQAKRLKAVRKAAQDARRLAERAARDLDAAQRRRDQAAQKLDTAEAVLADARERAEQAVLAQQRQEEALAKDVPSR